MRLTLATVIVLLLVIANVGAAVTQIAQTSVTTETANVLTRLAINSYGQNTSDNLQVNGSSLFNGTRHQVNNSGISFSNVGNSLLGNLTNATLSTDRQWILPNANGTISLVSDIANRANLPAAIAYEDEANTFALVQTFSDGIQIAAGDCVVFNADGFLCRSGANSLNTSGAFSADTSYIIRHEQVNGTFIAKTNSYMEGPSTVNGTAIHSGYLYVAAPNLMQANGTFIAKTNSYMEGPLTVNGTAIYNGYLYVAAPNLMQANGTFVAKTNSYLEGLVTLNNTGGNRMLIGNNTVSGALPSANLELTITSGANNPSAIRYGGGPSWNLFAAQGTATVPTAVTNNLGIGGFNGGGYDGSVWQGSGQFFFQAAEAWTTTAHGTKLAVQVVPTGTTALANVLVIDGTNANFLTSLEIDGDLNHDGTNVGFYGKAPVAQAADIVTTTDNTGGTVTSTCAAIAAGAVYTQADGVAIKNCLASLIAKINALELLLDNVGLTA